MISTHEDAGLQNSTELQFSPWAAPVRTKPGDPVVC